jgi:catechol 2,3-dioxygenase-like lactoylglutathione lyase family enzyme
MAKIRHIALATKDPETTAAFFKTAFEFKEVGRMGDPVGKPEGSHGIFLSDGTLNLAVLKFGWDQIGKGLDYVGLHHFGVLVDDVDQWTEKLEGAGADCFARRPEVNTNTFYEVKFRGPEGLVFDISENPWLGSEPLNKADAREQKA